MYIFQLTNRYGKRWINETQQIANRFLQRYPKPGMFLPNFSDYPWYVWRVPGKQTNKRSDHTETRSRKGSRRCEVGRLRTRERLWYSQLPIFSTSQLLSLIISWWLCVRKQKDFLFQLVRVMGCWNHRKILPENIFIILLPKHEISKTDWEGTRWKRTAPQTTPV